MSDLGLDFGDPRWATFRGGYKIPYDPRPALDALAKGHGVENAWHDLWEDLHHQGDIGEASFAAIPHLVRIQERRGGADWNTYALPAIIELARDNPTNPTLPAILQAGYAAAWVRLAEMGRQQIGAAEDDSLIRAILSVLALAKGKRRLARLCIDYTEDELGEV